MGIFITIWALWFLSEVFLNIYFQSRQKGKNEKDQGSFKILWISIGIGNTLGVLFSFLMNIPISHSMVLPFLGLIVILLGMIIRMSAIISLGKMFTVDVTIRENHKIKKNGMYGLIRHPAYSGAILSFAGFGLSLNNWISLILILLFIVVAMLYRIHVEERMLEAEFGEEYAHYKNNTKRLIPWIY